MQLGALKTIKVSVVMGMLHYDLKSNFLFVLSVLGIESRALGMLCQTLYYAGMKHADVFVAEVT